jgi:hypothetical protein
MRVSRILCRSENFNPCGLDTPECRPMTRIWKCSWTRSRKQAASAFSPTNSAARRSNVPVSLVGNAAHQTKTLCARPNAGLSGSMEQGEARVGYEAVDRIIGAARSRGRFCLPLRSSLFSGESPRNFLILPPNPAQQGSWPCTIFPAPRIRQPYTLHHPGPRRLIAHAQLA